MLNWDTILNTAIGTLVGGLVAAATAAFFARRETPRPAFLVTEVGEIYSESFSETQSFYVRITNVGNGPAHYIEAQALGTSVENKKEFKALLKPGKSISIRCSFLHLDTDLPGAPWKLGTPAIFEPGPAYVNWPDESRVQVIWGQAPSLRKRNKTSLALRPPVDVQTKPQSERQ